MSDPLAAVQEFYRQKEVAEGENEAAAEDGATALSKVTPLLLMTFGMLPYDNSSQVAASLKRENNISRTENLERPPTGDFLQLQAKQHPQRKASSRRHCRVSLSQVWRICL